MALTLARALRVDRSARLALVGGGGKTAAMACLARELAPAIATATTHLGTWQTGFAGSHIVWPEGEPFPEADSRLQGQVTLISRPTVSGDRLAGLTGAQMAEILTRADRLALPLLIEADGTRQRPLKAPAEHEPPIPDFVDSVVVCAGLTGIGKPLTAEFVHRPELFARVSGLPAGAIVTSEAVARAMTSPGGSLKNIPPRARRIALLNQADTPELQATGLNLARALLGEYERIVIASLRQETIFAAHARIAGIVLAAGESRRFGGPKALLDWRGKPLVRHVAETALAAGLDPVLVVTGADAERIELALRGLPARVVRNPAWAEGQSASIRAALTVLPDTAGGAVFLLVDQPQAGVPLLRALVEHHAREQPSVLAPMVEDRRANPVLFDRETFPALKALQGDIGGRGIFARFPPRYMPWHDALLLQDIDTPEDYQRLREAAP